MDGWGAAEAAEIHALLASVEAALLRISELPLARLSDDALVAVTSRLERSARRMLVPQIALTGDLDGRHLADRKGCASTAGLLSALLTISTSEAAGRVRAARLTLPSESLSGASIPAVLEETGAAVARGEWGSDQLRVVTATMTKIPAAPDADRSADVEFSVGAQRADGLSPIKGLLDAMGTELVRQALEPLAAPQAG